MDVNVKLILTTCLLIGFMVYLGFNFYDCVSTNYCGFQRNRRYVEFGGFHFYFYNFIYILFFIMSLIGIIGSFVNFFKKK